MWLDQHYKILYNIDQSLFQRLANNFMKIDWENPEFRWSINQKFFQMGRRAEFPFIVRKMNPISERRKALLNMAEPIVNFLQELRPNQIFIRGEFAVLPPKAVLDPHIDPQWFHKNSHRIHIPIYTNPEAKLIFEESEYFFPAGSVYEINNQILHSAKNLGTEHRLHLIFDMIDKDLWEANSNIDRFKKVIYD